MSGMNSLICEKDGDVTSEDELAASWVDLSRPAGRSMLSILATRFLMTEFIRIARHESLTKIIKIH